MIGMRSQNGFEKNGFTLIELMVVIAIIGILAAISIPNYSAYRKKAYYASIQATLRFLMDGQDLYMLANEEFYPRRGRINIPKGVSRRIDELAYTFPDGHLHRYRIRGINNRRNNRYIIDVWADFDFNGNGSNDRIQCITWLRDGRTFRDYNRTIRHFR